MIDSRVRRPVFASGFGGFGGTPQAGKSTVAPNAAAEDARVATEHENAVAQAAVTAAAATVTAAANRPNATGLSPLVGSVLGAGVNASGQTQALAQTNAPTVPGVNDFRIRLSPLVTAAAFAEVLGPPGEDNLLNPLYATSGMMFPFTPQITVAQDVSYQDVTPVHSNMEYMAYTRTPSVTLSISGKYTVQNQTEGAYALACLHFLRTVSKMYFGENPANKRGTPPPILVLNGYGSYMFNDLRVVLKSHTYTFNETMDTVLVKTAGGTARLPALFDLALTLVVQQTPNVMRKVFNLDEFRTGALLRKGGWI